MRRHPSILLKSKNPCGGARPVPQRIMYTVYKIFRWIYVSIWFYFFPFIVLVGMYVWPIRNAKLITNLQENADSFTNNLLENAGLS